MVALYSKINQVDKDLGGGCGVQTTGWGVTDALNSGTPGTFSGLGAYRPRAAMGRVLPSLGSPSCGCGGLCGSCGNG